MSRTQRIQIILREKPTPNSSDRIVLNPVDKTIEIEHGESEESSSIKLKDRFVFDGNILFSICFLNITLFSSSIIELFDKNVHQDELFEKVGRKLINKFDLSYLYIIVFLFFIVFWMDSIQQFLLTGKFVTSLFPFILILLIILDRRWENIYHFWRFY